MTFDKLKSQKEDQNPLAGDALSPSNSDALNLSKWEEKKLGEVCEFINGLWKGKKEPFQKVGVIRNTNFSKDYKLDYSNVVYLDVESNQFAKRKLKYGDIILEKSGGGPKQPVGRVVVFDKITGDYSFSNFTSAIRIKDDSEIDFNYLYKYLMLKYISGETEKMQSHSTGIRNLKFDDYKEIPIPLPPLSEQKKIVEVLDQAFAGIEQSRQNTKQNLKNAKEIFESYLQLALSPSKGGVFDGSASSPTNKGDDWEEKKLGEVCEIVNGSTPLRTNKDFWENGSFPWFTIDDIRTQGRVITTTKQKVTEAALSKLKVLPVDTVLLCCTASVGEYAITKIELTTNQQFNGLVVKDKDQLHPEFLMYYCSTLKDRLLELSGKTTIDFIAISKIKNLNIPLPPLSEQKKIVQELDALRAETQKLEAIYTQKINALDELQKSLLQKAFAGELVK